MFYLGCPIWSFKGWVGTFYPKGAKPSEYLFHYARRLSNIEGNTTFYAVPSQDTLDSWIANTPETFRFCPKIPKVISHEGSLKDNVDIDLVYALAQCFFNFRLDITQACSLT